MNTAAKAKEPEANGNRNFHSTKIIKVYQHFPKEKLTSPKKIKSAESDYRVTAARECVPPRVVCPIPF